MIYHPKYGVLYEGSKKLEAVTYVREERRSGVAGGTGRLRTVDVGDYRCSRCNYEQQVPDFVVDEFAAYNELPSGVMPELECGNCGGTLKCVD